jgi:putative restriction endonuclease
VRAFVAVTDKDWYQFLAGRPDLDEVNFWQPGGNRAFRALSRGEPLLFKLHHPDNAIVGGGFLVHASLIEASLAWEAFGEKNGAPSYPEMRRRIERYRRAPTDPHATYQIGCIILVEPFFWPRVDWIPAPEDFSRNIVQGKTYDLQSPAGVRLWQQVMDRLRAGRGGLVAEPDEAVRRRSVEVLQRLGQGAFRILITDAYERRPRWTPENRPVVDGAKPASEEAVPSVSVVPRSIVIGKRLVAAVWACAGGYPDMAASARGASEGQSAMRHCAGEGGTRVMGHCDHSAGGCASYVAHR